MSLDTGAASDREMNAGSGSEIVGLIPAAGHARRMEGLSCGNEILPVEPKAERHKFSTEYQDRMLRKARFSG